MAQALTGYAVIVTKSTVPVGTGRRLLEIMREVRPDGEFDVASNPEFLREGSAIGDFMRPDRIVIGTQSEKAREVLRRLYRPLYLIEAPILFTALETAELTKYAANSFLAMKVTFINEMADLCEKVGADVHDVARGIGLDGRIGRKFLHPGPGYGGSCFPKDTLALARIAQDWGAPSRLVETTVAVNDARKAGMAARVVAACGGSGAGQDDRDPGADVQARDRRHARCAEPADRAPVDRGRGGRPRLRSRGDGAGTADVAGRRRVLSRRRGRARRGARSGVDHGVERIPCNRTSPACGNA